MMIAGAIADTFNCTRTSRNTEGRTTMKSISTTRGDAGETSLGGGVRISKGSARVDTYGNVDELTAAIGFARSLCTDPELIAFARSVQQDLFKVGAVLAT